MNRALLYGGIAVAVLIIILGIYIWRRSSAEDTTKEALAPKYQKTQNTDREIVQHVRKNEAQVKPHGGQVFADRNKNLSKSKPVSKTKPAPVIKTPLKVPHERLMSLEFEDHTGVSHPIRIMGDAHNGIFGKIFVSECECKSKDENICKLTFGDYVKKSMNESYVPCISKFTKKTINHDYDIIGMNNDINALLKLKNNPFIVQIYGVLNLPDNDKLPKIIKDSNLAKKG